MTPTDLAEAFKRRVESSPAARCIITLDGREQAYLEVHERARARATEALGDRQ